MAIENRFASENYVSEVLENYTKIDDLNDYAKLDNLNDYAKLNDLNDYSKLSDLNDYAKLDALNNYATTEYVNSEIDRVLSLTERVKSWGSVQYYVRTGQAPYIFNIGDQLVCNSEQFGELTWDIIGFDQDTPADSQYTHSMTLQLHNILDTTERVFDAEESFFRTSEELGPGDYYFINNSKVDGTGTDAHYALTIPDGTTIPANAILYGTLASCGFYSDGFAETYWTGKLLSKGSTAPTGMTYLGEINYNAGIGGSNDYELSGIRCFLNGEEETLNWTPKHDLDIAPPYANDPGFLYQIDPEFKAVLGSVNKEIYNHKTGIVSTINDLVFIPSSTEIYGGPIYNQAGEAINIGEAYQYYVENTVLSAPATTADTCRIKYDATGTAKPYYLREPYINATAAALLSAQTSKLRAVLATGGITGGSANGTGTGSARFLAPCCCIV